MLLSRREFGKMTASLSDEIDAVSIWKMSKKIATLSPDDRWSKQGWCYGNDSDNRRLCKTLVSILSKYLHYNVYTCRKYRTNTLCPTTIFTILLSATIDFLLCFFVCLKVFLYLLAVHNPCTRIIIVQVNADKVIRREKKQQLNSHSMKKTRHFFNNNNKILFRPLFRFILSFCFCCFFSFASFGTKCSKYLQLICALSSCDAKFVFQNSISCQNGLIQFIALQFSHPKYCIEVKNFSGRAAFKTQIYSKQNLSLASFDAQHFCFGALFQFSKIMPIEQFVYLKTRNKYKMHL